MTMLKMYEILHIRSLLYKQINNIGNIAKQPEKENYVEIVFVFEVVLTSKLAIQPTDDANLEKT